MRLLLTGLACLLLLQSAVTKSKSPALIGSSGEASAQDSQQSAELEEARQLNLKVVQLYKEGKFDEALPLAKRVLQRRERALGREHQLVTEALINLAELNLARKLYGESLSYYDRILKSNERAAGPDDVTSALLMDKVAFLRYMTGDFGGAEKYYRRALEINERASGAESELAVQSTFNLAEFYRFTGSLQKAEPLYQRALPLMEKSLGLMHPKLVVALEGYACLLTKLKREGEGEDYWKRAGDIRAQLVNEQLKAKGAQALTGEKFSTGQVISKPQPLYPPDARRRRLMGKVVVRVTVDGTGSVIRACGSGAHPLLVESAEQAAMGARFSPLIVEGIPVETRGVIFYGFTIR